MTISAPQIYRVRKFFSKLEPAIGIPYLIQTIRDSYARFLQADTAPDAREPSGLEGVFREIFPISDFNENARLEYISYYLEPPKFDEDECRQKGLTYESVIRLQVRLIVWEGGEDGGEKQIRDIKEQNDVYFGTIPLMTDNGTFIINGTERVIVSQLHRSPGVYFDHDKGKSHSSGKILFAGHVIPYRGSWLDFEFDHKDLLYTRIDRRRKLYATILLKALGMTVEEILERFYPFETVTRDGDRLQRTYILEYLQGQVLRHDVIDPKTGDKIIRRGRKIRKSALRALQESGLETLPMDWPELVGRVAARDHIDPNTGEVLLEANQEITEEHLEVLQQIDNLELCLLYIDGQNVGPYIRNTLAVDKVASEEEAKVEIYRRLRPGDPVTKDSAEEFFRGLFFDPQRYDLGEVGRLKTNYRLQRDVPLDQRTLDPEDILAVIEKLIDVKHGRSPVDDIDHLGNRRVRSVGELLEQQFRMGVVRMERAIRERMSLAEIESMVPHEIINSKPAVAAIKDFFSSGQLSQFMDQTNPLSEVTHKRRLSALGPGGLSRERAGFEVRDVHPSHYGRICPIETPEGPNIGLISSLATYARVNRYGFIETPYQRVEDSRVTNDVTYLSALEEEGKYIAQANAPVDDEGRFVNDLVSARLDGNFVLASPDEIVLKDVSPMQLVSVAASLVPFLEHDDANRALMGSNMQRQGVPLLRPQAPFVGTGMEGVVGRDSGRGVNARRSGVVERVEASRIVIRVDEDQMRPDEGDAGVDIYKLRKFRRSNQDTCINQTPIVKVGDRVEAGEVIADGSAMDKGELALGQNVLVAFMPWRGYNFEDSILLSERLVKEDVYTSIHIKEYECVARDTKLGPEEITRDIPNLSEEALRNLDESGIVRIGADVEPNDILVGKITPKGETLLSPEEKLLRSIFGAKAGDVRDTSLRVPAGIRGTVIGAQIFHRKGAEKDFRALEIERLEAESLERDRNDEIAILEDSIRRKIREQVGDAPLTKGIKAGKTQFGKAGVPLPDEAYAELPVKKFLDVEWKD
ncbi:MAG: DNA-directed RNA polymerase subunit beta, partial [Candidatus Dadabacteria bacterium]